MSLPRRMHDTVPCLKWITGVQFWSCRSRTAASGSPNAAAFWYQLIASDLLGCKPTAPSLRRKFGSNVFPTPVAAREFPLWLRVRTAARRRCRYRQHCITPLDQNAHRIRREGAGTRGVAASGTFRTPSRMALTVERRGGPPATVPPCGRGSQQLAGSGISFFKGASGVGRVGKSWPPCARIGNRGRTFFRRRRSWRAADCHQEGL